MAEFGADSVIDDEELEALALAADPDPVITDDAIPLSELLASAPGAASLDLLPGWYMPSPAGASRVVGGWRRRVVLLTIASFVAINAYGLCNTYGVVGFG